MQATRQDLYMNSRFASFNSFIVAVFSVAVAVGIAGTFFSALSQWVV